jgi:hypothetical protein
LEVNTRHGSPRMCLGPSISHRRFSDRQPPTAQWTKYVQAPHIPPTFGQSEFVTCLSLRPMPSCSAYNTFQTIYDFFLRFKHAFRREKVAEAAPAHVIPIPNIPLELYFYVIRFVHSQADLLSLCLVSQAFYEEASLILFSDCHLPMNQTVVTRWFATIAEKPRLANAVRSVELRIPGNDMKQQHEWADTLREGFKLLKCLIECVFALMDCLAFMPNRLSLYTEPDTPCLRGVTQKMLNDAPFQLRKFRNYCTEIQDAVPFLAEQHSLLLFHRPDPSPDILLQRCELPINFLPSVTDVHLPSWALYGIASTSITHLQTYLSSNDLLQETAFITHLSSYRTTLRVLKIHRHPDERSLKLVEVLRRLADCVPLVEELYIWHTSDGPVVSDLSVHVGT